MHAGLPADVSSTSEESEDDVPPPLPEKTRKHGSGEPIEQGKPCPPILTSFHVRSLQMHASLHPFCEW